MPELSKRTEIYKDLVESILREHGDMIEPDRLDMFLAKARRRYPLLKDAEISDDLVITLEKDVFEDEENCLQTLSTIMACAYKVLEMFLGAGKAKENIIETIDEFREKKPELEELDLKDYLPKREETTKKKGPDDEMETETGSVEGEEEIIEMEDIPEGREGPSREEILKMKGEGVPFYDEEKKEWVLKPAHMVKKVKTEDKASIEPVYETGLEPVEEEKEDEEEEEVEGEEIECFEWFGEDVPVGSTLFVEGTGQEKNMLCAEFLKEGIDAGEEVVAIVGYSPRLLKNQLKKIGVTENDLDKIQIIDWYTFKERHVVEVETSENVHIVPKDPKFIGSEISRILKDLGDQGNKRAFISIVSYALAFIDFETVYNFIQVTKLKFQKANVTGLFTIEAGQHSTDIRKAFQEISDGWIRVREGLSGANTWKMKAALSGLALGEKREKDVVIMRNGIVVLDRSEGKKKDDETDISIDGVGLGDGIDEIVEEIERERAELEYEEDIDPYLLDKMDMWRDLGFSVEELEDTLEMGEEAFKEKLKEYEKMASRALEIRGRLDELKTRIRRIGDRGLEEEVEKLMDMIGELKDLDLVEKQIETLDSSSKRKLDKESKRRDREKEIFRIRMEHWNRQGYDTGDLEEVMDEDLDTVNEAFAEFRKIVNELKDMEENLNSMDSLGHEEEIEAIRERLFDVKGIEETRRMYQGLMDSLRVKKKLEQTAKSRRNELMNEAFNWALEGYCVDLIDKIDLFEEDLSDLESRLGKIRKSIARLKRMEGLLNELDLSSHREEEREIRDMIKDIDRVDEVERRVMALQEEVGGRLSGDLMAIDENIEKVRELEQTWQNLKSRLLSETRETSKNEKQDDGED